MIGDLRHALRTIVRMPALAAVVIASLGAGIGANTIVFSWVEAIFFRPVAGVRDASGLHTVETRTDSGIYSGVSWLEYQDLRARLVAVRDLVAFRMVPLYVGESGRVERGNGLLVSGNYFSGLGLQPALGRLLRADDAARPGGEPVAVISHDYWHTRFAGARDVVGQTLRLNGQEVTIVGVAPRGFRGTTLFLSFDLWLPATLTPVVLNGSKDLDDRGVRGYTVIGRMAPGATRTLGQQDLDTAMRELAQLYPQTNANLRAELLPFWQSPRGPQRFLAASVTILQGIMLLLLVAVCGNTANLVLARACARQKEIGVRLALGAGRWHVARLLLTENLLLAVGGSALGAALSMWGTNAVSALPPMRVRGIPITFQTPVDGGGLAFAVLLGLVSGVLFGLAPVWYFVRADSQQALRSGSTASPRSRLRNTLMAVEAGLALVVLVVAGLFLRSFLDTRDADPGFKRDGVLLAEYDLTGRSADPSSSRAFAARLLQGLRAVPAIKAAAIASSVPLDIHGMPTRFFTVEGHARPDGTLEQALANTVTPGYFDAMGIPFREGRDFADLKDVTAPAQVVVNDEFVRRYLEGAQPIGRWVETAGRRYVIAGVVRTSLYNAFGEAPTPIIYFSYRDRPGAIGEIHLRSHDGVGTAIAADVRRVVRDIDPELPIYDVRTLNDHIEANLIFRRVPARLFAVLGPLLLMLAAIGIYAVVGYTVSQRTREIGVRLALGATARRLVGQLVGENLIFIGLGALVGWVLSFAVAMDVTAGGSIDLQIFMGVPMILLSVALLASWLPARRASRVDPLIALRHE